MAGHGGLGGSDFAGHAKENVIPGEAIIKLNVRTFDEGMRKRELAAIVRVFETTGWVNYGRLWRIDVVLGQHVMVGPAGAIGGRAGVIISAGDSLQIRLFGRGAHGSMPQASVDPVVMAAKVMRLQTIVSRELAAAEAAVVTIGSLQAAAKENVIPDEAVIKLNVRSFDEGGAGACSLRSNGSSTPRPRPRAPPGHRR